MLLLCGFTSSFPNELFYPISGAVLFNTSGRKNRTSPSDFSIPPVFKAARCITGQAIPIDLSCKPVATNKQNF